MHAPALLAFAALATALNVRRQAPTPASTSVAPATPSPTAPLTAKLPPQAALPPKQAWCPSTVFCPGPVLQSLNLAAPFADSKTIVDKPTTKTAKAVVADYNGLAGGKQDDLTVGDLIQFLDDDFGPEGTELEPGELFDSRCSGDPGQSVLPLPHDTFTRTTVFFGDFVDSPDFLKNVSDPVVQGFAKTVHGYWNNLVRQTNTSTLCTGAKCESTLIPLNHTFVVPGGRFREIYYWDSYFVMIGLLTSQLHSVAKSTLLNFMDQIDRFGFIPNGGRIYYLDRSQPPFFIPMLHEYVEQTGDKDILDRGLPMAEAELKWWADNRAVSIKSPFSGMTRNVTRYAVINSAPRPESYLPDYLAANGPDLSKPFSDDEKADVYAELATGAESGWDYSSRWMREPFAAGSNTTWSYPALRTLNLRATLPVDLNSILYKARTDLAALYTLVGKKSDAQRHTKAAGALKDAIVDLFWDAERMAFYDFNVTANARSNQLTAAHFYPLWAGIHPKELTKSSESAFKAFATLNLVLRRYNGTFPATFVGTGQQWDAPNAWPMHQYLALKALERLPANVTAGAIPDDKGDSLSLVPKGQIGEGDLPVQTLEGSDAAASGDVGAGVNVGNASDAGWARALAIALANRYTASAFCSWHATGGTIPGLVQKLDGAPDQEGQMFEKFSMLDVDSAGRGGEYVVQAGFGWTNGVLLYVAGAYGDVLSRPACPLLAAASGDGNGTSNGGSGGNSTGNGNGGGTGGGNDGTGDAASLGVKPVLLGVVSIAAGALLL
ncbi:glycoside hydrolase [Auricularia subglabra TFB-10046 SS5]|nr:glycoside hydrolase [Auricularia subglabra TFB-10046 SS5]